MRPSEALAKHRTRIRQIAMLHRVRDVRVFGSAARGDDTESSDLDILVEPTAETTLLDIGAIQQELQQLLGLDVDVLTPGALPDLHRERILSEALPV
jgi:predicted nucleotidyltransferase